MTGMTRNAAGRTVAGTVVALLLPMLLTAAMRDPQPTIDLSVEAGAITISGTSNAHDWTCRAAVFTAELRVSGPDVDGLPGRVDRAAVTVPVTQIDCGKKAMDRNLAAALDADRYPTIAFTMTGHRLVPDPVDPAAFQVVAEGTLTVAGATRPLSLTVDATAEGDRLRIRGAQELMMTDFGVEPPTALLGVLKTGDRVVVEFDLTARYDAPAR